MANEYGLEKYLEQELERQLADAHARIRELIQEIDRRDELIADFQRRIVELDASGDVVEGSIPGTATPELHSEPITAEEAKAMARGAVILFRLWGVTDDQAAKLLNLSVSEYCCWKGGEFGIIDGDTAARLSNLTDIHRSLTRIFLEPGRAYDWVKVPNITFGGRTALNVMLDGNLPALIRVRRFLNAQPRWEECD